MITADVLHTLLPAMLRHSIQPIYESIDC